MNRSTGHNHIEDIQVGDLVYSYDTITGEVELKAVTKTIELTSKHVRYITLKNEIGNTQTLETTDSHPFWMVTDDIDLSRAARSMVDENGVWLYHGNISPTEEGYWVEAKDLHVGDMVLGANGELSLVQSTMRLDMAGGISVFNIEVEGNHNYFVLAKEFEYGQTCVLVHNADCKTTVRRFMGRDEYKRVKKEGLKYDPTINRPGIPSTTRTIKPENPQRIKPRLPPVFCIVSHVNY